MYLKIEIDNQSVDLDESFSFTLVKRSQLFQDDTLTADIATDMTFPKTDRNEAIFGFANRLSKVGNTLKTFTARVTFKGMLLISGTAKVTNAGSSYSAYIYDTRGEFNSDNKTKSISDFVYDLQTFSDVVPDITVPDVFCCPQYKNTKLHDTRVPIVENDDGDEVSLWNYNFLQTTGGLVNHIYRDDNDVLRYHTAEDAADLDTDYYAISPFIFVNYVLGKVLEQSQFELVSNALADDNDMKWLCFLNVNDITQITNHGTGTGVSTSIWVYNPTTGQVEEVIVDTGTKYSFAAEVSDFDPGYCLPVLTVKELIIGLQNLMNVCFVFNKDRTVNIIDRREKLLATSAEDWNQKISGTIEVDDKDINGIKLSVEQDSDDDYVSEYMNLLTDDQRSNYQGIVDSVQLLPDATIDTIGDVYLVSSFYPYPAFYQNQSYTDYDDPDDKTTAFQAVGWVKIAHAFQNYYHEGETASYTEIQSALSPLPSENVYPITEQVGNRNDFNDYIDFGGRLIFYHGRGSTYANATNELGGAVISGKELSLRYDGDYGLYNKRWKEWIDFLQYYIPISFSANLDEVDINNLHMEDKKRISEGQLFIEEVSIPISVNHIGVSDVTARFIPNDLSF